MTEKKEVVICKFDNEIECSSYLCEEDCSDLEMYLESGKTCPLFVKSEKLDVAVYKANKILDECDQLSGWGSVENQLMRLREVLKC
jgi:hypothetical protein